MLNKIWNRKFLGIPKMFIMLVNIILSKSLDKINSFFWRSNLKHFGKKSIIQYGATIRYPGNIHVGNYVNIGKNTFFTSELDTGVLIIGNNTIFDKKTTIDFSGYLEVGNGVTFSEDVFVQTHSHGMSPRSKPIGKKLVIEDNVWIGAKAIILYNTHRIGANSIIAAGSLVTKEVPPNTIFGGVPASKIGEVKN